MDMENTPKGDESAIPGATPENGGGAATLPPADLVPDSVTLVSHHLQGESAPQVPLNRDGTPRKKPGRKPGQKNGTGVSASVPGQVSTPKTKAQIKAAQISSEQTAKLIVGSAVGALIEVLGPEMDFENQGEADNMVAVTTAYLEAKGGAELSPEAALALSLSGYFFPRLRHPTIREKITGFFKSGFKAISAIFRR